MWSFFTTTSSSDDTSTLWQQAQELYRDEKYQAAADILKKVVGAPDVSSHIQGKAFHTLGKCLIQVHQLTEALQAYEQALSGLKTDQEAYAYLHSDMAIALFKQQKYEAALNVLDQAMALAPDASALAYFEFLSHDIIEGYKLDLENQNLDERRREARAHLQERVARLKTKQPFMVPSSDEVAATLLNETASHNAEQVVAEIRRRLFQPLNEELPGISLEVRADDLLSESSFEVVQEVIRLDLESVVPSSQTEPSTSQLIRRGVALIEAKNFSEAIPVWQQIVQLLPERSDAYATLSECWLQVGEYERALLTINKAITLEPSNGELYLTKADILASPHFREYEWALELCHTAEQAGVEQAQCDNSRRAILDIIKNG